MEKKVLSIGIAAYNMERYLRRCIDSLLIPSLDKLEITLGKNINVDFGSKQYKEREVMKPCQVYKYLTNWTPKVSLEEGFLRFLNQ